MGVAFHLDEIPHYQLSYSSNVVTSNYRLFTKQKFLLCEIFYWRRRGERVSWKVDKGGCCVSSSTLVTKVGFMPTKVHWF